MPIKNIVFDVGNVLVQWNPLEITKTFFPYYPDPLQLAQQIFRSATWIDLNLGKISPQEAIEQYHCKLNIDMDQLQLLMPTIKKSLIPVKGGIELLKNFHKAGFPLYALTDNVKEIMSYLKEQYDFWPLFTGVVVSAEIGYLKPSPEIYHYLLKSHQLIPNETLFLDDHLPNVEGAQAIGMQAIQFISSTQCVSDLAKMGVTIKSINS